VQVKEDLPVLLVLLVLRPFLVLLVPVLLLLLA